MYFFFIIELIAVGGSVVNGKDWDTGTLPPHFIFYTNTQTTVPQLLWSTCR